MSDDAQQTITVTQAATLLGRSDRWVHSLRERGLVTVDARGRYPLVATIRAAMAYYDGLLDDAQRRARANRATDARTREIELRTTAREATLIGKEDVIAVLNGMASMTRAEFSTLPRRAARGRAARAALSAEVEQTFERIEHTRRALVAELEGAANG